MGRDVVLVVGGEGLIDVDVLVGDARLAASGEVLEVEGGGHGGSVG